MRALLPCANGQRGARAHSSAAPEAPTVPGIFAHALRRWQTPEEIADLVVFLASDLSRSLTGAVLNWDRGWTAFKMPEAVRRALGGGGR